MRIRCNSKLWLVAMLAVSAAACGDDDDNGGNGNNGGNTGGMNAPSNGDNGGDANDGNNDGEPPDLTKACAQGGVYDGFTGEDIKAMAASEGACISDTDIAETCVVNPSTPAGMAGASCFLGSKREEELRVCTIEGDATLGVMGLRDFAPNLSDGCLRCYAEAVGCSAEMGCGVPCAQDPNSEACITCRAEKGCTSGFYECSGLPAPEELNG